jgi:hypothetical protein
VGLIAPHAGYVYSGPIAGTAYATVASSDVRTVIVMSPSHHAHRSKASTLLADVYRTPIGDVPIATDAVRGMLAAAPEVVAEDPEVFLPEHALDVQIPFVKVALPNARLIPLIVPLMAPERLAKLASLLFGMFKDDPHALVIASSDLSHFFDYETARKIDGEITAEVEQGDVEALIAKHDDRRGPCGAAPIAVALEYLQRLQPPGRAVVLDVRSSGDTQEGNRDRVVGYAAVALVTGGEAGN